MALLVLMDQLAKDKFAFPIPRDLLKYISLFPMIKQFYFTLLSLALLLPTSALAQKLSNPLGDNVTIEIVIGRVIKAILGLSGMAALLMFVWGGVLWLTSRGDTNQINKGKDTLKWATFGIAIILLAYTLTNAVIKVFTQGTALS